MTEKQVNEISLKNNCACARYVRARIKTKVMEIDVKSITPEFCQLHCPYYDADYQPCDSDFEALYVDGNCLFTEFAIPCQLLDTMPLRAAPFGSFA